MRAADLEVLRSTPRAKRAIFLDKDGTLVENVPYNVDPALVELTLGAGAALERFAAHGFGLVVVSNQAGVAHGLFPSGALRAVERRIQELLAPSRVAIDAFYYCIHSVDDGCECRKPAPGLLRRAAAERGIDLARSWIVGDILDDVEAGHRAGCRSALIVNGNETLWRLGLLRIPEVTARSLELAASKILDIETARRGAEERHARLAGRN